MALREKVIETLEGWQSRLNVKARRDQIKRADNEVFTAALNAIADQTSPEEIAASYGKQGEDPKTGPFLVSMIEEDRAAISKRLAKDESFKVSFNRYAAAHAKISAFEKKYPDDQRSAQRYGEVILLMPALWTTTKEAEKLKIAVRKPAP